MGRRGVEQVKGVGTQAYDPGRHANDSSLPLCSSSVHRQSYRRRQQLRVSFRQRRAMLVLRPVSVEGLHSRLLCEMWAKKTIFYVNTLLMKANINIYCVGS